MSFRNYWDVCNYLTNSGGPYDTNRCGSGSVLSIQSTGPTGAQASTGPTGTSPTGPTGVGSTGNTFVF